MCAGLAIERRKIPDALIEKHQLADRIVARTPGAEPEVQFLFRARKALLPVKMGGELAIVEWGNRDDKRSRLPKTGWCRIESLERGSWQHLRPAQVDIIASYGLEKGVWFPIAEGMLGVRVFEEQGVPHVYMLTQPASPDYQAMTHHDREPVFIERSLV
jgi:hypothetical protein